MSNEDDVPSDATPAERAALRRTRTVARLLDDAVPIPGTGYRIGLDGIVGLLPVAGDAVTAVVGLYIVAEAVRAGASASVVGRMLGNLLVDTVVGSIPVVGDVFDVVWKANVRNVELFEAHVGG